jgi:hypothetical protein
MSAQVVRGVLGSGLLSNPLRLLSVVTDAAASMTTDAGMSVSDLVGFAQSLHNVNSANVQFITAPNQAWPSDPTARVQFAQPQADQVFAAIAHDVTVPKTTTSPAASPSASAQVLTTSPGNVKVTVLNGSGMSGLATQAAAGLTSRGFDVTGTGDAANFGYATSVIEYASSADQAAVNTLKAQLASVTTVQDATLTPGTVELILGSDFTGLSPASTAASASSASASTAASPSTAASSGASGQASSSASASGSAVSGLAAANGGITAAASCASDSSAFAGPLSP